MKKKLILGICAIAVLAATVVGTMAYFTDSDADTNTFAVGSVHIKLDEANVNPDGSLKNYKRVTENEYHLIPGHTYIMDPTVTVLKDSSECYVRMLVTVNFSKELDAIFAPGGAELLSIFDGYAEDNWALHGVSENEDNNTRTYEFRYVGAENKGSKDGTVKKTDKDIVLDDLFEKFTIPGEITKEQLATLVSKDANDKVTDQFTINVVAHAIQADGFESVEAAWVAFASQNP